MFSETPSGFPKPELLRFTPNPIITVVSAEQLLKHVRALSASERRKFLKSINTLRERKASRKGAAPNRVKWPDVEARAQRIFGHRILPNLVELDRNKSAGWCAIDRIKDYAKTATSWSEK